MIAFLQSLNIERLQPLRGFHNTIYEGVYKAQPIIIRISTRRNVSFIQAEVAVLNHVKTMVSVGEPIKVNHQYVISHNHKTIAFFKKIEGLTWQHTTLNNTVHYQAGQALGLLHKAMQSIHDIDRSHFNKHPDLDLLVSNQVYLDRYKKVLSDMQNFAKKTNEYGLIHGDYLYSNLIYHTQSVTIIDFDDIEYNYYLYDIAVYLFYLLLGGNPASIDRQVNIDVFVHFIKGYRFVNKETQLDFRKINTMFALRELKLFATINTQIPTSMHKPWHKAYIMRCIDNFKHDKAFIDIPYQAIYDALMI